MSNLHTTVFATACAALLIPSGSLLRAADYGIPTNLSGVASAPEPPPGFDPIQASDMELDMYGFPSRPDSQTQPEAYRVWIKAMRGSKKRIVPELRIKEQFHGPAQGTIQRNGAASSFNWSGAVMTDGAGSFSQPTALNRVFSYIVVPPAKIRLRQQKYADAEALLRNVWNAQQDSKPDSWARYFVQSLLGAALASQKRYADAEPLLIAGYLGMKQREAAIPIPCRQVLHETVDRIVKLYESWSKQGKAAEWRAKAGRGNSGGPDSQ